MTPGSSAPIADGAVDGRRPCAAPTTGRRRSSDRRCRSSRPVGDDGLGRHHVGAVGRRDRRRDRRPGCRRATSSTSTIVRRDDDARASTRRRRCPTASTTGYELGRRRSPAPTDTVLVHGADAAGRRRWSTLADLDVDEGTPVLDDDGDLVGLCTGRRRHAGADGVDDARRRRRRRRRPAATDDHRRRPTTTAVDRRPRPTTAGDHGAPTTTTAADVDDRADHRADATTTAPTSTDGQRRAAPPPPRPG